MAISGKKFIESVKSELGSDLPNDLIFEYKKGEISFYNKSRPRLRSSFEFNALTNQEKKEYINRCVGVIKNHHL